MERGRCDFVATGRHHLFLCLFPSLISLFNIFAVEDTIQFTPIGQGAPSPLPLPWHGPSWVSEND
jgi:hypothetical protein